MRGSASRLVGPVNSLAESDVKRVFATSVLGAQHERNNVEKNPASFLVVSLSIAFSGVPPCLCGRKMTGHVVYHMTKDCTSSVTAYARSRISLIRSGIAPVESARTGGKRGMCR